MELALAIVRLLKIAFGIITAIGILIGANEARKGLKNNSGTQQDQGFEGIFVGVVFFGILTVVFTYIEAQIAGMGV